jgi:alpha-N-arabinofuranosidase
LRDAVVAGLNLNIFAHHADRVRMAAIAQMVNVLQAMILTDGNKMVLTPTYPVFAMYKGYMDGTVLPIDIKSPWYGKDKWTMPAVSASAVRGKDGVVRIALANLDPNGAHDVSATLPGLTAQSVSGKILTAPVMTALNSFDAPNTVAPVAFPGARLEAGTLAVSLPPKSVVMLELK